MPEKKDSSMERKKVLIIYSSKRGTTAEYADWISEGLREKASEEDLGLIQIDCMPYEDFDFDCIGDYDVVIYGGWLRGSGIVDLDKVEPFMEGIQEKCIIYCCGISDYNPANFAQICEINFGKGVDMSQVKLYYCPGRYDPSKVKGMDKMLMAVAKHVLIKGSLKSESNAAGRMKKAIEDGADLTDKKYANQVVKGAIKILQHQA